MPDEGRRLVEAAAATGLPVRLIGGVAIWLRTSVQAREALGRNYPDLDLVAHEKQSRKLRTFLEEKGYEGDRGFNARHGAQRLLFHHPEHGYQIDIFLDVFNMSHKLSFRKRLELEPLTLPAADLLLTKLQIAELNQKDVGDATMLLLGHELGTSDTQGQLNTNYLVDLCAHDWGLYTTVFDNLEKTRSLLRELTPDAAVHELVSARITTLLTRMKQEPKSMSWKTRAVAGRRVRWYDVPEEVAR